MRKNRSLADRNIENNSHANKILYVLQNCYKSENDLYFKKFLSTMLEYLSDKKDILECISANLDEYGKDRSKLFTFITSPTLIIAFTEECKKQKSYKMNLSHDELAAMLYFFFQVYIKSLFDIEENTINHTDEEIQQLIKNHLSKLSDIELYYGFSLEETLEECSIEAIKAMTDVLVKISVLSCNMDTKKYQLESIQDWINFFY